MRTSQLFIVLACGMAMGAVFAGCSGGKRDGAKGVNGGGRFPGPVDNTPTPPQPPGPNLPPDSVELVKQGTVFQNQAIDELTRVRIPNSSSVDMTKPGHVAGRFVNVTNAQNVFRTKVFLDANFADATGKHNGNPSEGGRALSRGANFEMTVTVTALQQDTWSFASQNISVPETFATYTMQHDGNQLYSAEVEVPAYGAYILNFYRVSQATVNSANGNPPADWFVFGLEGNSGYDIFTNPRGIMCYNTTDANNNYGFGVIHNGSEVLPPDAVQDWPSPFNGGGGSGGGGTTGGGGGTGGGSGGGGTPTSQISIASMGVAPVATSSITGVHLGFTPRVTVPVSYSGSNTLNVVLQHTAGSTGTGAIVVTSAGNSGGNYFFDLSVPSVHQRISTTFTATAADGVASIQSTIAIDVLVPNHFADIADVNTQTITKFTNAPHSGLVGPVTGRTRSDGYGCFAFDPVPRNVDGSVWSRSSGGIPYFRCWTFNGQRLANTSNINPPTPVGYPSGSNLDGGFNGRAGTADGTNRYVYLIPLGRTVNSDYGVYFALNGEDNKPADINYNYFQTAEYDDFFVPDFGFSVTMGSDDRWKFNRNYQGVDSALRTGGAYENGRYPFN